MQPYTLHELSLTHDEQIFYQFILTTSDYFTDYQITSPSIEDVRSEFWLDLPPDTQLDQKKLYGIFIDTQLVGFVDILLNYPQSQAATLRYLVLHQNVRKQNLGTLIYQQVEIMLTFQHYRYLRLGVITDSPAFKFLGEMGFEPYETIITDYGEQTNMFKSLK